MWTRVSGLCVLGMLIGGCISKSNGGYSQAQLDKERIRKVVAGATAVREEQFAPAFREESDAGKPLSQYGKNQIPASSSIVRPNPAKAAPRNVRRDKVRRESPAPKTPPTQIENREPTPKTASRVSYSFSAKLGSGTVDVIGLCDLKDEVRCWRPGGGDDADLTVAMRDALARTSVRAPRATVLVVSGPMEIKNLRMTSPDPLVRYSTNNLDRLSILASDVLGKQVSLATVQGQPQDTWADLRVGAELGTVELEFKPNRGSQDQGYQVSEILSVDGSKSYSPNGPATLMITGPKKGLRGAKVTARFYDTFENLIESIEVGGREIPPYVAGLTRNASGETVLKLKVLVPISEVGRIALQITPTDVVEFRGLMIAPPPITEDEES